MARINLIFFWDKSAFYLIISSTCLILHCKDAGFVKGKCSGKNKKRFHVNSAILGFIKNVLNSQEKILNQLVSKKSNSLCLVFINMFGLDLQ